MALFATEDVKKIDDLYHQGRWPKIIQNLGKQPLRQIDDIRLLNDLAVAYQQEKQWDQVIQVCERIGTLEPWPDLMKQQAELTPRYMRYHAAMGEALYRRGEYDKALAIFNDLKAVGSRFSDKYYYSGRIYTIRGDFRKALLEFKGMIAHVPKRMRDVIRGLGELINASPAQAGVYQQFYRACQHNDRVAHYLSRYKNESPGSIPSALKVANLLFYDGKKEEALEVVQSISPGSDEERGWLEVILSDWALEEGGVDAAVARLEAAEPLLRPGDPLLIERYEEVVHSHGQAPEIRRKLVELCEKAGDLDKACRNLEALVEAQPEDPGARDDLGRLLRQSMSEAVEGGDMECAGGFAERLLKVFPDDSNLAAQVEQIAQVRNINRKEKLEGLLATGRMPASEAARAHFEMADIERSRGAAEEDVISHLQKAAGERSPVRAEALEQLGRIHMDRQDTDTAEGVYEILFSMRLPAEDRLTWAYEAAERFEEMGGNHLALKYFEQVKSEDPTFRDAAGRAGRLFREMEASAPLAAQAAPPAESQDPMTILSRRYDDINELGRGAMGVVYKARDKILGRPVAIKMILEDVEKIPEAMSRFVTEAQSAAALEHPGIITIYDIHADAPMFIVMEFVEGKSLNDLLKGRKCPMSHFSNIALKICEPIAFAHKAHVVHRDIKPDNIMVTKNGGVKIADFGLSRKGEGSGTTQIGQVMGTPYYMPPEQIRGGAADGRSDIYALGITLYEMLTGTPPFREGDIAYLHMHEEPPRISVKNPEVPQRLEDVIMKCLRKEPEERFQSVDELLDALRSAEPVKSRA